MVEKHWTKLIFWLKFEYQDPERPWLRNILNSFKCTVVVLSVLTCLLKCEKGFLLCSMVIPKLKGKDEVRGTFEVAAPPPTPQASLATSFARGQSVL